MKVKFSSYRDYTIESYLNTFIRKRGQPLSSCLEIGCGRDPVVDWFCSLTNQPRDSYTAVDTDAEIVSELRKKSINAIGYDEVKMDQKADLVIAKEVIEHNTVEQTKEFLSFCKAKTGQMFALTTPNFEYWPGLKPSDRHLRFTPDHFRIFSPDRKNPHYHKQEMTPESLNLQLLRTFHEKYWEIRVIRAWPWVLTDCARVATWEIYFKIFALVVRRG